MISDYSLAGPPDAGYGAITISTWDAILQFPGKYSSDPLSSFWTFLDLECESYLMR